MDINITVRNKIAILVNPIIAVCGNSDYVVKFDFDSEWDAFENKTARFKYNGEYIDIIFTGNECNMPVIKNAYRVEIGVYAGDLHTTTSAFLIMKKSVTSDNGAPAAPAPDVYDQLMQRMNELEAPDWEQNDETKKDYIKNRPFYTESQNQTCDTIVDMSESKYIDAGLSAFSLFEGTKYSIKWDGKEYESVCKSDYGILHIGNFALYDRAPFSKIDTGETFCVLYDASKNWIIGEKAGASHHIILSYGTPTEHMLNPKYIGVQSKQPYMSSDEGRVKYLATPDGNYELVVPEIPDLRNSVISVNPKCLASFRVTEAQMNTVTTSEYTEIKYESYDSNYNKNNLNSYYVDFYIDGWYHKLLPRNSQKDYIYFLFTTKQEQTYCLKMEPTIGEFKIKRLNTDILGSITGIVTADKLTSPDHPTDLVNYEAFQAAVPRVQQMNISGATVGQTIKVKTVDANGCPTSWEAAEMASGEEQWELNATYQYSDLQFPAAFDLSGAKEWIIVFSGFYADVNTNINIKFGISITYSNIHYFTFSIGTHPYGNAGIIHYRERPTVGVIVNANLGFNGDGVSELKRWNIPKPNRKLLNMDAPNPTATLKGGKIELYRRTK